jgi:hypothetical protein
MLKQLKQLVERLFKQPGLALAPAPIARPTRRSR